MNGKRETKRTWQYETHGEGYRLYRFEDGKSMAVYEAYPDYERQEWQVRLLRILCDHKSYDWKAIRRVDMSDVRERRRV